MKSVFIPSVMNLILSGAIVAAIIYSRSMKKQSIQLERRFLQNLYSKDFAAQQGTRINSVIAGRLIDHNIHISEVTVPQDSLWAGKTLAELSLGRRFDIHVSSIQRGHRRINIPSGTDILFPGDILHVIGNDDQLTKFYTTMTQEVIHVNTEDNNGHEIALKRFVITGKSMLLGKTLITSGLRENFFCTMIGIENEIQDIARVSPTYCFQKGDIVWIVGEEDDVKRFAEEM